MKNIDKNKLDKCIRDLEKIVNADKLLTELETMKSENVNIKKYLNYIFKERIVTTLEEVFYLVQTLPELSGTIAETIRNSDKRLCLLNEKTNNNEKEDTYRYSGVYYSLNEVPGYGTEFNERCIPEWVTIRGRNSKNCRC